VLKNHKHLFRNSERLKPSVDLWQKIEVQVQLKSIMKIGAKSNCISSRLWQEPLFRWAACLTLAFGIVGTIWMLREKFAEAKVALNKASNSFAWDEDEILLDPELLVWDADLGETEFLETTQITADDSAEEIL
jgi:hypothetical protein